MSLSIFRKTLIISSVYAFAFWSVPAESGWLNAAKEIDERFEAGYITFQDPVVSQNIQLAQAKSAAERKQEAEDAEQAALKKLEELKKKIAQRKQAGLQKAQEDKLKEEARLEQERKLKIKEEAQLKAEKKARREQQLVAQFPDGHPCFTYDASDAGHVAICIEALRVTREQFNEHIIKNKYKPEVLAEYGYKPGVLGAQWLDLLVKKILQNGIGCDALTDNYQSNLKMLGFENDEIRVRTPDCVVFAQVYQEKYRQAAYWSGCLGEPQKDNAEDVSKCINPQIEKSNYVAKNTLSSYNQVSFSKSKVCREMRNMYLAGVRGAHTTNSTTPVYDGKDVPACEMLIAMVTKMANSLSQEKIEKRNAQWRAEDEYRNKRIEIFYKAYYEETPERKESKYSALEHRLMKDGIMTVPASYAAPTAEEIRLAVMRSMVNRAHGGEGNDPDNSYIRALKRQKKPVVAVVTDGDTIYLPKGMPASVGMQIDFGNAQNARCNKRSDGQGYMCQYRLNTQAEDTDPFSIDRVESQDIFSIPANTIAKMSVQYMSRVENYTNWFILTEKGWRQPHTSQDMSEIQDHERSTAQSIQQQNNRPREEDATMLDDALQGLQSGFSAQGAEAGLELNRLW
ncbi:cell envelope integrity protein TolA [Gammaproteobacteria bacterium]|nr:cell envelope integrity protein TolA [Gammaproteobacteria bacterium]